jgi:ketosteroid isomerase-like protein
MKMSSESMNTIAEELLRAIGDVDQEAICRLCGAEIELQVPVARDVDLNAQRTGVDAFCAWVMEVRRLYGQTRLVIHHYFESGHELIAAGAINIKHYPQMFSSSCSMFLRFEMGQIASFQLLVNSYVLEKFRSQMD